LRPTHHPDRHDCGDFDLDLFRRAGFRWHERPRLRHHGCVLEVTFVRRRGGRDRVYVTRDDRTSTGWEFPSYGDGLPHDLCHLVVEDELSLPDGFWGLVDRGVEVGMVDNQSTLVRDRKRLVGEAGADFTGLNQAEAAVAVLAGPAVTVSEVGEIAVAHLVSPPDVRPRVNKIAEVLDAPLPESATPDAIAAIRERLQSLGEQWRHLDDGDTIKLAFSRPAT